MAWFDNFMKNCDRIKNAFDDRFYRIGEYCFLSCAASFRARINDLGQIGFQKTASNGLSFYPVAIYY